MKPIVLYSIIGSAALVTGAGAGVIYKRVIVKPDQNIVGFNPDACKVDGDVLIADVESRSSISSVVKDFEPYEIANYALEKYKRCENCFSYAIGSAVAPVVNQYIRNAQIKVGDLYFEEAISKSSMVGVGKRMYQEGIEGDVSLYNEKSSGDVSISDETTHTNYIETPDNLSSAEYKTLYGRNLPDMVIYIIHQITVKEQKIETIANNGGYTIKLVLDPVTGGYNYRFQMQTISGLDKLPQFEYINLEFTLTNNLELKKLKAEEKYKATMLGISPDLVNTLEYTYFPNQKMSIPDIKTDVDYKLLEGLK